MDVHEREKPYQRREISVLCEGCSQILTLLNGCPFTSVETVQSKRSDALRYAYCLPCASGCTTAHPQFTGRSLVPGGNGSQPHWFSAASLDITPSRTETWSFPRAATRGHLSSQLLADSQVFDRGSGCGPMTVSEGNPTPDVQNEADDREMLTGDYEEDFATSDQLNLPKYHGLSNAIEAYLSALADRDRAMAGQNVGEQRQALDRYGAAILGIRNAAYWLARRRWRRTTPENHEEIASDVLEKLIRRDQPRAIARWLSGQIQNAAVSLAEDLGLRLIDLCTAPDAGDCAGEQQLAEELAAEIQKSIPGRIIPAASLDAIAQALRKHRFRPSTSEMTLGWVRRLVLRKVFPSEIEYLSEDHGKLLLDLEMARNAGDDLAQLQKVAAVRSVIVEQLHRLCNSAPDEKVLAVLDAVANRNHPGAIYNWITKAVQTTTDDCRRVTRKFVNETGAEPSPDPPDPRDGPEGIVLTIQMHGKYLEARDTACEKIRLRWPKFAVDKTRCALEMWIDGYDCAEIAHHCLRDSNSTSEGVKDETVYQWVSRYRGNLGEVLADLPLEQQPLIREDIDASYRRKTLVKVQAKSRPRAGAKQGSR